MRALFVVVASLFVLSACGPSSPPASSPNGSAPASTSTGCSCHAQQPPADTH